MAFGYNKAQNLVYNGYFEIADTCPNKQGQISRAAGWVTAGGSPDYNNICNNSNFNVPHAHMGYQQDCCGGGGIAGEYMMVSINTPGDDIGREYMETKLIDTLKAGHKYLVSMYVNRANFNYSIATIGMLFTDTAIVLPNLQQGALIQTTPQIRNNVVLTDTANWVLIRDTITAIGNEAYLTIGNYNTTATSDTVSEPPSPTLGYGSAYYYIDGVSVYDVATLGVEQNKNIEVEISVYPNPSNGNMFIDYKCTSNAMMEMMDITGNLVGTYNLPATENTMQVKNDYLQNGVYLYRIISNNAVLKQGKIIVMK